MVLFLLSWYVFYNSLRLSQIFFGHLLITPMRSEPCLSVLLQLQLQGETRNIYVLGVDAPCIRYLRYSGNILSYFVLWISCMTCNTLDFRSSKAKFLPIFSLRNSRKTPHTLRVRYGVPFVNANLNGKYINTDVLLCVSFSYYCSYNIDAVLAK